MTSFEPRNFDEGFFLSPATTTAINQVRDADRLTIFVGAGISADQNVPQWASLVRETLTDLLKARTRSANWRGLKGIEAEFSQNVLDSSFQLPVATMIDQLCLEINRGKVEQAIAYRNDLLRKAIYFSNGKPRRFDGNPSLARSVLDLAIVLKVIKPEHDLHIVTTNYDSAFKELVKQDRELARRLKDLGLRIVTYGGRTPTRSSESEIPIVHIHGHIPRTGETSRPIFSEPDYVWWTNSGPFRDYVQTRLDYGLTLMLGTSLRDHNIVNYITRTTYEDHRVSRIALMPVQGDAGYEAAGPAQRSTYARLLGGRLANLGIEMLTPDFYSQVNQFLHEATHAATCRHSGREYVPYMRRLGEWWKAFAGAVHADDVARQTVTLRLRQHVADMSTEFIRDAEHLKIEIWTRHRVEETHDPREFQLWANSQSVWLSGDDYWPHAVATEVASSMPAIRTFASRSAEYGEDRTRTDGRWTHFVAAPVILYDKPYDGIPVGSVVLRISAPRSKGALATADTARNLKKVADRLTEIGTSALTP